jgi:hypothetical protein
MVMKLLVSNLLLIFLLLNIISPSLVSAKTIAPLSPKVCFTEETAAQLTVDLDQCEIQKEEIEVVKQQNVLLIQNIELYKKEIELQKQQIEVLLQTVNDYKGLVKTQQEQYTKIIEDNKPSTIKTIINYIAIAAGGFVMGMLLH